MWQTFSGVIVDILKDVPNQGEIMHPSTMGWLQPPAPISILSTLQVGIKENSFPNTGMDGS